MCDQIGEQHYAQKEDTSLWVAFDTYCLLTSVSLMWLFQTLFWTTTEKTQNSNFKAPSDEQLNMKTWFTYFWRKKLEQRNE